MQKQKSVPNCEKKNRTTKVRAPILSYSKAGTRDLQTTHAKWNMVETVPNVTCAGQAMEKSYC